MKKLAIASGTTYVLAWIIGLVIASGGPKPDASAAKVASYFGSHEHGAMVGHLFVDGIAGISLVAVALLIFRFLRATDERRMARAGFYAALAAAAISLAQFVVGETFTYDAAHSGSAETVRNLFVALNDLDTVKIAFLGAMIAAVSVSVRRTGVLPRWFARYGLVAAPLLVLSGFAFPFNSGALLALLELTLLLLLVWIGIFASLVARRSAPIAVPEAQAATT